MDKLTKIVALADFIEPGRKFDGVEKIREAAKNNLDEAVVMMLKVQSIICGRRINMLRLLR